jgi:hypothetical protein
MEPGAASHVPEGHVVRTASTSAGATFPARVNSRSPLPTITVKAYSLGTSVRGTTSTFGWTA